jgi:hypothetical protein
MFKGQGGKAAAVKRELPDDEREAHPEQKARAHQDGGHPFSSNFNEDPQLRKWPSFPLVHHEA